MKLKVEIFSSENDEKPVLIINLWTMANYLKQDVKDVIVGYRLNKLSKRFEEFLEKLEDAGAEMIFVFKKTQIKELDFVNGKENDYEKGRELIDKMKVMSDFDKLKTHYERKLQQNKRFELPFNHAVIMVLSQVAERFGMLHGMNTINCHASTFQVQLAMKYNAMAIMGLDTYYVFYDGSWAFWSDADLDMNLMTIRQYNRKKILSHMNITVEKAPLFVTLAGGLRSDEAKVKKMVQHFQPWTKLLFKNVADTVNKQKFPLSDEAIEGILTKIFGRCQPDLFEDFRRSLQLMDPNGDVEVASKVDSEVMTMIKDDFSNLAEEILENSTIYISPVYLDLRFESFSILESFF